MDFRKMKAEASTAFNRAKQFTEEKLGTAERTELDAHFENLLQRADKTKDWTEKILSQTEAVLQPNPSLRMEDFVYGKLDKKKRERNTNTEILGQHMIDAGNEFGPGTSYGNALVKCGQTEQKLGQAERELLQSASNNFLQPLKAFLEGDMKTVAKERSVLEMKRLDLDAAKNKMKKAKAANKEGLEEMVATAEADLRVAQSEFDRQSEITKLLLEGISSTHAHHLRCLTDFVEAQSAYYSQCQQYMTDLQKQLGGYIRVHGSGGGVFEPQLRPPVRPSAPRIVTNDVTPVETRKARVLYDYDATDLTELSLIADEIVNVHRPPGMDQNWMMCNRGGQSGKIPLAYIQLLDQ